MSHGHGTGVDNQPAKPAFVKGTHVMFIAGNGRRLIGPDQDFFPSPDEVFVSFPATGFTVLLPVTDLEVALPKTAARTLEPE